MSQVNEKAFQLIKEAHQHCFCDNCYQDQYGTFSRVSPAMSAWLTDVENFILSNFGRSSFQWNNFNRLDRQKLSGYYEEDFEKQKAIIISALQACIRSEPQQSQRHKEQRNKFDSTAIPLQLYIFGPHLAVIAILVSVLGVYNYCNRENRVCHREQEQHKDNNTAETLAIMQPSKEAAVKETQEFKLYRIVDKEDFSYRTPNGQLFVLKDYRILLLSTDATSNQIQNIAQNIATQENNVNALNVYFFWPGTEKAEAYTAAMATYAPNGRWDDFQKSTPKELVMKYGRATVDSTLRPTSDFGFSPASSSGKRINNNSVTSKSSSYSTMSGDYTGAWVSMTYFVKDRLKAPSSAKFEYAGARNVMRLDNDRYRIKSYVDAQNSFGAPIRMHFEGVVRDTKASWKLEELYVAE